MHRRNLLKALSVGALGAYLKPLSDQVAAEESRHRVKTVYVLYKCHLDVGFTDTEQGVIRTYFNDYFPGAMEIAEKLRESGGEERYVWTVAAWLLYEYLEQATSEQRRRMEKAIADGDFAWHAMPFTWNSEMLDGSLISSALKLSASLDQRFGRKTVAGKLTDVPCHSRGIVIPLANAGIRFLDIGDNAGCKAPEVPFMNDDGATLPQPSKEMQEAEEDPHAYLFNWRDPTAPTGVPAEIMVLYHPFDYGSTVAIPGTDVAVSIRVRGDNSGPHAVEEIKDSYRQLHSLYPGARIIPTNLSVIANALEPLRPKLPVVTKEMGDTWIYGVGSDPGKVARYRELCRLRGEWLSGGKLEPGDATDLAMTRKLILAPEHNWGLSIGQYLQHPEIYSPNELASARSKLRAFKKVDAEWEAKRADMDRAVAVLPPGLREEAEKRLAGIVPKPPNTEGLVPLAPGREIQGTHFILGLDAATGAILRLQDRKTGREWASAQHPLASFRYQTFTSADFARFNKAYNTRPMGYDFSKPGLEKYPVQSRTWQPSLQEAWAGEDGASQRIVADLRMPQAEAALAGLVSWPERLTMEIRLPDGEPVVQISLQCFNKRANRLSEAMWLSFSPSAPEEDGWRFVKVGQPVSPHDVIRGGGLHLHAVTRDVIYRDAQGTFTLETLDAPLVSPGQRGLLVFDNQLPEMREGIHVNLYSNLWGTAFPQWYGDDMRFRFVVRI